MKKRSNAKKIKATKKVGKKLETNYYEKLVSGLKKTVRSPSRPSRPRVVRKAVKKAPVSDIERAFIDFFKKKQAGKKVPVYNTKTKRVEHAPTKKIEVSPKVEHAYDLKRGRSKKNIQRDIVKKFISKLDRKAKFDEATNTYKLGKSTFTKKEMQKYQDEIREATKEYEKMLRETESYGTHEKGERLEDFWTTTQWNVLTDILGAGLDLQEFKSKYPEAYARIFGGDEDNYEI